MEDPQMEDPQSIMLKIKHFIVTFSRRTSVKTEEECLQYLSKLSTPKLSEDEKSLCEEKLTLSECLNALSSLKNGKSLGNDRSFTSPFLVNWDHRLLKTFNYSFEKGEMSASQK